MKLKEHLEEINRTLHVLAAQKVLSSEDLKFLEACLHNKWIGVQVVATKVLAKHRPPEALPLLKARLMRFVDNFDTNGIYLTHKALLPCISEADVGWIFDLYLKQPYHQYFLIGALIRFPDPSIMQKLIQECQKYDNKSAIVVLARVLITDRDKVLQALLNNPDVAHKKFLQTAFTWRPLSLDQIIRFKKPL